MNTAAKVSRGTLWRSLRQTRNVRGKSLSSLATPSEEGAKDKQRKESAAESLSPLYKNSRAAERPRANLRSPLYASPNGNKGKSANQERSEDGKENSGSSGNSHRSSLTEALNSPLARSDSRLRELYEELEVSVARHDVVMCVRVCKEIKERLVQLNPETTTPKPPLYVYVSLLNLSSMKGAVDVCNAILEDMQAVGHNVRINELNWVLRAAMIKGDSNAIFETLEEIAALPDEQEVTYLESEAEVPTKGLTPPLLSRQWTRNWNAVTYRHLINHCSLSYNLEFALALLGSASRRRNQDGDEYSFLTLVLTPYVVQRLFYLVKHCKEARLAVELAEWIDNGIGSRRLSGPDWMSVLRTCASSCYFPGVKAAWKAAVDENFLTPDDGLIMQILITASRDGESDFIRMVLHYHQLRLESAGNSLQEWHLMPLFDSECINEDFTSAIYSATRISRVASQEIGTNALIVLGKSASKSRDSLQRAYEAYVQVGRDQTAKGGVSIGVLNSLLTAANRLGDVSMAIKIYRSRKYVRHLDSPPGSSLERILTYSASKGEGEDGNIDRVILELEDDDFIPSVHTLKADIDTFNKVLLAAVLAKRQDLGRIIFRHLNASRLKGTEDTYERAIRLELLNDDYQDAFKLLEECKRREMIPSRFSYYYIGMRCLEENDPRWIGIGKEMLETGYNAGRELRAALIKEGYIQKQDRYEQGEGGYGQREDGYGQREDRQEERKDRYGQREDRYGQRDHRSAKREDRYGQRDHRAAQREDRYAERGDRFDY